jgi:hypothetical protein
MRMARDETGNGLLFATREERPYNHIHARDRLRAERRATTRRTLIDSRLPRRAKFKD